MELIRSWGIEDEVLAGGDDVEWLMWECETLADAASGSAVAVGYPTTEQSAMVSPTSPGCVPQDHLENVLMRHLRSYPHARLELGTEVVDVSTGADGVGVTLRRVSSGEQSVVNAGVLVAADGAHSLVRERLGIAASGSGRLTDALDGAIPRRVVGPRRTAQVRHLLHHQPERARHPPARRIGRPMAVRHPVGP